MRKKREERRLRGFLVQEVEFPFETGARLCGDDLKRWLMNRGLSLLDAGEFVIGIPDFKSTSIALDDRGRIVDYDQYYQDAEYVISNYHNAIKERLMRMWERGIYVRRLVYFDNVKPDCLEFHKWTIISPYER
jgi:hypothetical protein